MTVIDRTKVGKKAQQVLNLLENTPDGVVIDADTILADLFEKANFEESGMAAELLGVWARSEDKASVEQLFCLLTDCDFEDFLDMCIANTTRSSLCPRCQYVGDKYSFLEPNDLPGTSSEDPEKKRLYCCCGDSDLYGQDVTDRNISECEPFEEL